ncbi:UDP-N-acetylmuramoyl-L-alanyl-D-glutamate--2,6-diaminopimelate ligase [Azohydromonas caseinilytica]|uniref:UDP-N-acetylmuramoyl-L-alanyl-D-glutamate--2,6-diaminopimelate ligase n=1 Tax=Azohydromonas caseinilytica TaxID=2728836 RepID=A0A848FJT0_9BURK|nr:UDP-N-acetylmuramoyl-L-alanyl-D-glutamate--2,6-diaminopimelate ligase [Azohydromonas caseinilytica]NML18480.1 UDP-N-acetylmuramoyl-L-alanyl-D-glutamate--2,6-diaminopimelate ligase [Azohydromonas caseinilytica]
MALSRLEDAAAAAQWLRGRATGTLRSDSRLVRPGDAFMAWPGAAHDARRFVAGALAAGASACLVASEGVEAFGFDDPRVAALPRLKAAAGLVADAFFGAPSTALELVASTGTNGKTSTSWWTAQALTALSRRCGLVGTLGIGEPPRAGTQGGGAIEFTGLTTPDPVSFHAALRRFADAGFKACALEASSIGLVEQRLAGARIDVALFTNFTRDHLDFHGDMAGYWAAKRGLFDWPGLRAAVINIDDAQGAALARELAGRNDLDVWTYSIHQPARLRAEHLRYEAGGLAFELAEPGGATQPVRSRLIGDYNASNLLAVLGGLRALGVAAAEAAAVVPLLTPVPGRMQQVGGGPGDPEVVVDYAHTPDALEKALTALRPLARARGGRLWCVFGCGGDRDPTKRPLMGAIAQELADAVVLTSDNPRSEPPGAILAQIAAGLPSGTQAAIVEDRRKAILDAVRSADPADVLLIAGKGHEDYQDIGGRKLPFSDIDEALNALQTRKAQP